MPNFLLNPMFDLLLELSHRDDSNKRSNIGFGQEIMELASIEVYFTHVIWSSESNQVINAVIGCVSCLPCSMSTIFAWKHCAILTNWRMPPLTFVKSEDGAAQICRIINYIVQPAHQGTVYLCLFENLYKHWRKRAGKACTLNWSVICWRYTVANSRAYLSWKVSGKITCISQVSLNRQ